MAPGATVPPVQSLEPLRAVARSRPGLWHVSAQFSLEPLIAGLTLRRIVPIAAPRPILPAVFRALALWIQPNPKDILQIRDKRTEN